MRTVVLMLVPSLTPLVDDAYSGVAGQQDSQKARADCTTKWFTEDRCLEPGTKRGVYLMAHYEHWTKDHILDIPRWLHECIFCLGRPWGKFSLSRYLQLFNNLCQRNVVLGWSPLFWKRNSFASVTACPPLATTPPEMHVISRASTSRDDGCPIAVCRQTTSWSTMQMGPVAWWCRC